jgi:hypothetical protein
MIYNPHLNREGFLTHLLPEGLKGGFNYGTIQEIIRSVCSPEVF